MYGSMVVRCAIPDSRARRVVHVVVPSHCRFVDVVIRVVGWLAGCWCRFLAVYLHLCMPYYVRFKQWLLTVHGHSNCLQSSNKTIYCVKSSCSERNSRSRCSSSSSNTRYRRRRQRRRHRNDIRMKSTCNRHNTIIIVNSSYRFWVL